MLQAMCNSPGRRLSAGAVAHSSVFINAAAQMFPTTGAIDGKIPHAVLFVQIAVIVIAVVFVFGILSVMHILCLQKAPQSAQ